VAGASGQGERVKRTTDGCRATWAVAGSLGVLTLVALPPESRADASAQFAQRVQQSSGQIRFMLTPGQAALSDAEHRQMAQRLVQQLASRGTRVGTVVLADAGTGRVIARYDGASLRSP
jgi:hypothetical protein